MGLVCSFRLAIAAVLLAAAAACGGSDDGGRQVDATAREYAFQGLSSTLEAGDATFSIDNKGIEVHEIRVFKLADDVGTVSSLLGKSQDEALDKMTSVGMASANPGDTESFDARLSAGRYAAVCLIPVGHGMEQMEDTVFDPNADTHMRRGMFAEFTVG